MVKPLVCVLLYGDHFNLHQRLLVALKNTLPPDVDVHVWCNVVCSQTLTLIADLARFTVTISPENVPKYKAMRELVLPLKESDKYNWLLWFDDDTRIDKADWFEKAVEHIGKNNTPYFGESYFVHCLAGEQDFIKQSTWYRNRPTRIIKMKPSISFIQGSYWWLRADVLRALDWPDVRLNHNGGDTLLGEAVYQLGYPISSFKYGVKPNDAPRRGFQEKPAGSTVDCRR